jgi:hypothetical protein
MHRFALWSLAALTTLAAGCSSSSDGTTAKTDAGDAAVVGKGVIGDPCPGGNNDCATGFLCAGEDPGGGQCYKVCKPSTDADCGDTTKYACSHEGHCYLRCKVTADCPRASQGYVCKDDEPVRTGIKFCDVP